MSNNVSNNVSNNLLIDSATVTPTQILQQVKFSGQIPTVLEGIATRQVIAAAAQAAGIQVSVEELQQAADAIRLANHLHRSEDTWAWLQQQGLSLDEFEDMVQATVLSGKLAQHLFADKVESFFVEHCLDYTQVALYEIVLDDADLAMELFYAIQEEELNFHAVAHQYIQDQEMRRLGGYRGLLRRTDLKPEISAAVFAANPPQLLKPILTAKGAHLILVEEILQPQLDAALSYKILSDLFANWLKQQTQQIKLTASFAETASAATL